MLNKICGITPTHFGDDSNCGDLEIPLVVIGLGVNGLKKTGVVYPQGYLGEGEISGGAISCVRSAFG